MQTLLLWNPPQRAPGRLYHPEGELPPVSSHSACLLPGALGARTSRSVFGEGTVQFMTWQGSALPSDWGWRIFGCMDGARFILPRFVIGHVGC